MRPDAQTFVSTTTRSAGPSDLADGRLHVAVDCLGLRSARPVAFASPSEELVEPALPLVLGHDGDALRLEPGIDGVAHELGYRAPAALGDTA